MNDDFRKNVLLPIALPFGALLAILFVAFSLSRVLLAVPELPAVVVALGVAAYVLLIAFVVERRPRITSRALAVGLTLGLVAIGGAGLAGAAAGQREHTDEGAEGEGAGAAEAELTEVPAGALVWRAGADIAWDETPDGAMAGPATIAIETTAGLPHNVVFEGENGETPIVERDTPGIDAAEYELEAGTYTYYCSVPGHESGMTGELTVS